jgi:hypothetical protein
MAVDTYYFDGYLGISDPDSWWTNDANAFDGNDATNASRIGTSGAGSETSRFLQGNGTTAPTSGNAITGVRARAKVQNADGAGGHTIRVYTSGLGETLLSNLSMGGAGPAYFTNWADLSVPSGGWTWAKANELEVKAWSTNAFGNQFELYIIEIEVTSEPSSFNPAIARRRLLTR